MKRVKVSALRNKRELRPVEQVAEPPVVGLTPQTTMMTERTDTMKKLPTPQLQNCRCAKSGHPAPPGPAQSRQRRVRDPRRGQECFPRNRPRPLCRPNVHNDSIAVSIAPRDSIEVRR